MLLQLVLPWPLLEWPSEPTPPQLLHHLPVELVWPYWDGPLLAPSPRLMWILLLAVRVLRLLALQSPLLSEGGLLPSQPQGGLLRP